MTGSVPTSVSRYRPAIIVLTGVAAAYSAWVLWTTFQTPPPEGLHRSNAVRRLRTRRRPQNLDVNPPPAQNGTSNRVEFDFFGTHMVLSSSEELMSPTALHDLAERNEPGADADLVDRRITDMYAAVIEHEGAVYRASRGYVSVPPTDAGDGINDDADQDESDGQTLQRTLYHIAEERARQEGVVHRGITCNGCDTKPIRGIRWHCANCPDYDLCSDCEATNSHIKTHIFYKIRIPAPNLYISKQSPLYSGRLHMTGPTSVPSSLKRRLAVETRMDTEEVEALWEQFTCLAATKWESDPNNIGWALDRRAFNDAFIPRYSSFKSAPNLIYDRVFAYFDTDHNTLIGFEEFVKGIDGMHATDRRVKLRIVFNGYDIDGDGYISRKDVLRIFRAHYAIEREATRNYLAETAEELTAPGALGVIQSAQPLGSAFTESIEPEESTGPVISKPSDEAVNTEQNPVVAPSRYETIDRAAVIAEAVSVIASEDNGEIARRTINERWARRMFYTDEEEGFLRPLGAEDGPSPPGEYTDRDHVGDINDDDEPLISEPERIRGSRSSSRVRFQDDVDIETRSNASTSSRPVGERWGGYEIPEPEKDLGRDVLYQFTQQAFNELLDPLFKAKEDLAMDAYASREERKAMAVEIENTIKNFNKTDDVSKRILCVGISTYANCVIRSFLNSSYMKLFQGRHQVPKSRNSMRSHFMMYFRDAEESIFPYTEPWDGKWQASEEKRWFVMMVRMQLNFELWKTVEWLAMEQGWLSIPSDSLSSPPTASRQSGCSENEERLDPTLPQFRPNSLNELNTARTSQADSKILPSKNSMTSPGSFFVRPAFENSSGSESSDDKGIVEKETFPPHIDDPFDDHPESRSAGPEMASSTLPNGAPTAQPLLHCLSLDVATYTLRDVPQPLEHHVSYEPGNPNSDRLQRTLYDHAIHDKDSHLKDLGLARLETVDREMNERQGGGLLSFQEFEAVAQEKHIRFLEAWVDWVSF